MMKTGAIFVLFVFLSLDGTVSARTSSVCTCDKNPKPSESPKIVDYNVRIKEEGTVFNEKVEIDEKRQTQTFEVPAHNERDEIQVLNDFKMKLTMIRSHIKKICYLMPLDPNIPTPKELKDYMDKVSQTPSVKKDKKLRERKSTFSVAKEVKDRTVLSDELASFCAKYPIIRLNEIPEATITNITKTAEKSEEPSTRVKRNLRFRRQNSVCVKKQIKKDIDRCPGGMCRKQAKNTCVYPKPPPALHCRNNGIDSCIYLMKCELTDTNCVQNGGNCIYNCFDVHHIFYVICCEYRCG